MTAAASLAMGLHSADGITRHGRGSSVIPRRLAGGRVFEMVIHLTSETVERVLTL